MSPARTTSCAPEAAHLLRCAAAAIEANGWLQGEYWPEAPSPYATATYVTGDPCCAVGALAVATGEYDADYVMYSLARWRALTEALRALAATISDGPLRPGNRRREWITDVAMWNDAEGRTAAEVVTALRAAADSLTTVSNRPGGSSATTSHQAGSPNHQNDSKETDDTDI